MLMDLEDVIALLREVQDHKVTVALSANESVQKQYENLGVVQGVKISIKKLEQLLWRGE